MSDDERSLWFAAMTHATEMSEKRMRKRKARSVEPSPATVTGIGTGSSEADADTHSAVPIRKKFRTEKANDEPKAPDKTGADQKAKVNAAPTAARTAATGSGGGGGASPFPADNLLPAQHKTGS